MKNAKRVILLLLLAALLLAGCRSQKLTVDPDNGTVSDSKYTYTYTDETTTGIGNVTRKIRIKYPNGSYYLWERYRGVSSASSNGQGYGSYDVTEYTRGEELVDAILEQDPEQDTTKTGVYVEMIGDQQFEINTDAETITSNGYVFIYRFNGDTVYITYPDGSNLIYSQRNVSWGNANEETVANDGMPYADYHDLVSVVPWPVIQPIQTTKNHRVINIQWPTILMGVLVIGIGVWMALNPRAFWQYRIGRWYKNAEPSDWAIKRFVIGGYIEIIFGLIIVLSGIF